jgi:enoyl-CoA hydratase
MDKTANGGGHERYANYRRLRIDWPHERVIRVTMANGKMNSADAPMHAELGQIWRDIDADPTVSAVIFTGAGEVFSAGGDFGMIGDIIADHDTRLRNWKEAKDNVYNVIN